MAWLRGNLHAHTTYSDGVKTPQELLTEYEALGYDFLAITDHEDLIGSSYWRAPPPPRPRPPPLPRGQLNHPGLHPHNRPPAGCPQGAPPPHQPTPAQLPVPAEP